MRLSNLFGRTLRETPSEAELVSHQLLLRAAMIRQLASGIFSYLPLGWRVLLKIEAIMREEMEGIGCQEVLMPVLNPADIWKETGRWQSPSPGRALFRFQDRGDHDMVLAMTHEEACTKLLTTEVSSYRDLPVKIFHIQTKERDEPRSRGGLIRVREFNMKDAYSAHADAQGLSAFYDDIYGAYERIFSRCGLDVMTVEADTGMMGGAVSHEFMALSEMGEDTLILCQECDYAANAERAEFQVTPLADESPQPLEEVATPGRKTIEEVAAYLDVPTSKTYKAVFFETPEEELIFAVLRGDLAINEVKLSNALGGTELFPASEETLEKAGIVAGYASPVGLDGEVTVVGDVSLTSGANFVAGANREGYHLKNVNYPRDFQVDEIADITLAREGDACPKCGEPLREERGIEVGHLFKLGTKYSEPMDANFLDQDGKSKPVVMGSYGIGTGRLMAAVIEQSHDAYGIIWPVSIAPYQIHLLYLGAKPEIREAAESLYRELQDAGYEVLYDDREESAGIKFNDADLIGVPLRLTVSARNLKQDSVEAKLRGKKDAELIPLDELQDRLPDLLAA